MERPEIWTPIIVAVISGILGQPITQLIISYQKRHLNNLLNAIEIKGFTEQCSEDFKSKFIIPNFQENYFYAQTGIKTNYKSIGQYIKLKEELGNNFTWDIIRQAKPHFKFIDGNIKVALNKWERIYKNVSLILGLSLFLFGLGIAIYFNMYDNKTLNDALIGLFIMIAPMSSGFLIVMSFRSLISAAIIEKRLIGLEKEEK